MKRIHLFELEDQSWYPNWLRIRLTRMINVMHGLLRSKDHIAELIHPLLEEQNISHIIDLCSGSGGPMVNAAALLKDKYGHRDLQLTLTDLYPNLELAKQINENKEVNIKYETNPIDVTQVDHSLHGLRTMVSSFHHMRPAIARQILKSAQDQKQPILIYEMSDNSAPIALSFLALPINLIMSLIVTLFVKPMSWQQIIFTYLIPVLPLSFAWDGAISNMRTYTMEDMDELLNGIENEDYNWTKGVIKDRGKQLYIIGNPLLNKN